MSPVIITCRLSTLVTLRAEIYCVESVSPDSSFSLPFKFSSYVYLLDDSAGGSGTQKIPIKHNEFRSLCNAMSSVFRFFYKYTNSYKV